MTDIDLDIQGNQEVKQRLDELKEDWTGEVEYRVSSSAKYSSILEFGRGPVTPTDAEALRFRDQDGNIIFRQRVSGHPPYPFFFPAINEYVAGPERFVRSNMGVGMDEADSVEGLLRIISLSLERQIKTNATAQASGRSPGVHPNHPQIQSGNLRAGISATRIR